jgi:hypothetical protein
MATSNYVISTLSVFGVKMKGAEETAAKWGIETAARQKHRLSGSD